MEKLIVHYHRYDNQYKDWRLWTWLDDVQLEVKPSDMDEYGPVFLLDLKDYPPAGRIGLLPKYRNWEKKDDPNRYWSRSMPREVWILPGNPVLFTEKPDISPFVRKCFIDAPKQLTLVLTNPVKKRNLKDLNPFIEYASGFKQLVSSVSLLTENVDSSEILKLRTPERIRLAELPGKIYLNGFKEGDLFLRGILDSSEFLTDEPLGVFFRGDRTLFSLYSPGATRVTLHLYEDPAGGNSEDIRLVRGERGVWTAEIKESVKGKYYTYSVDGPDPAYHYDKELIDPYARCVTAYNGRGYLTDDHTEVFPSPEFPFEEAIIYEMHVRDFTISEDSGVRDKGLYTGFVEEGCVIPGTHLSTGIDHLKELGINTVQLMPVQSFEFDPESGSYFWGYMPVNFNSPEGWFCSNPLDDSRIRELKRLVDKLHKNGIKVVLDVVYNHTAESNPDVQYNFNGIVPNFFYRQRPDGSFWNGSGCGNEFRTENPMVRRFIIESLSYWVSEFGIDGFRFDLMGLIDLDTMREIVTTLRRLRPDIFLYGEPWTAGPTPIKPIIKGSQRSEGFAVFNDTFRDALKGPWYNIDPGYVQKGINRSPVKKGIMGSITDFADSPLEVINYVACHDGRTLWDQLKASTQDDSTVTESMLISMDKLAAVIILTSRGIPFLHGGQEMLRTKFGAHNSYNLPDSVNMIRWNWKKENYDVFEYYKGLIQLRKEHPMLRMTTVEEIEKNLIFLDSVGFKVPGNCIAYKLKRGSTSDPWNEILVLINPERKAMTFSIPYSVWNLVVDKFTASSRKITGFRRKNITVKPISAMVLYR